MTRIALVTFVALTLFACPNDPGSDGGTGGGRGGGTGGGGGLEPFTISELDGTARNTIYFAMAVDPATERVGVAYYTPAGTETIMGTPDYDLKYVEWKQGVVSAPEKVALVQRFVGLAIAFDPSTGEPVIGFLGGASQTGTSIFWYQSDAVLARRSAGTWTESIVAATGDQVTCGNVVSDRGFLVGLWPAIAFDPTGKFYFAYRDAHNGQFGNQDYNASDVELWEGTSLPPTTPTCLAQGGNNKDAWGGHLQMIIGADGQPAIVYDQMPGAADTNGGNVIFQRRNTDGSWTPAGSLITVVNTQTGASLAYDSTEGYGIAAIERSTNQLLYVKSANGTNWSARDEVFGSGTGGWYPSLAMDPEHHEPAIAFYICSARSSVPETGCATSEDRLVVTQRIAGEWRETVVDEAGGYAPKLGFFGSSSGAKKVVVYRQPASIDANGQTVANVGALKIAVER